MIVYRNAYQHVVVSKNLRSISQHPLLVAFDVL